MLTVLIAQALRIWPLAGAASDIEESPVTPLDPWECAEIAVQRMADNSDVMRSDRLKQVMLELDPNFMEAYLALRSVPLRSGTLPAKVKELILVAINAATTHLYAPGVRRHMRNALKHGATTEELLEVIELTTLAAQYASRAVISSWASWRPRVRKRVGSQPSAGKNPTDG